MTTDSPAASDKPKAPSAAVRTAAESALDTIRRYKRGEIDGLDASRSIVNDESLREIVPVPLLLGFIGVEAQFPAELDPARAAKLDPTELAELRAERDELLTDAAEELRAACAALTAHLETWQREHPSPRTDA